MFLTTWLKQQLAHKQGIRSSHTHRTSRRRTKLESLEPRQMMSANPVTASTTYSIDGSGNNLTHTTWGATGADLLRTAPAQYGDGISTPAGSTRPSAREVSNTVSAQSDDIINNRYLSDMVYAWGQFIDHDLDLTGSGKPATAFNVAVPTGDPQFDPNSTGTQVIPLKRSETDPATGTSTTNPLQQFNEITAYLDGSMIYGSDATRSAALRTFVGGKMNTSAGNLLPLNTQGFANANDTHQTPDDQLFLAGDVRANENVELTSLQTLFVREHNRLADQIAAQNPTWTDEQIFQAARKTVIAEIQSITFNEFLPALLGPNAIAPYRGYKSNVNPGIANEFSAAAFRFGHSMVSDDVEFLANDGSTADPTIALKEAFFNPNLLKSTGIDPLLKYLSSDNAQEIDTHVVDSLRNFLFGQPGQGGLDLASLNIQRGRDHGLADYNTVRAAYGLPKVKSFAQITSDVNLQNQLQTLYGNVNNIDLWVGGLAENHVPGGSLGPTFTRIIANQFQRLRDGDRLWYQNTMSGNQLFEIQHTTLADIIKRNTGDTNLQANVFYYHTGITGRVTSASLVGPGPSGPTGPGSIGRGPTGPGPIGPDGNGLAGRTVQLIDDSGAVVATQQTDLTGRYFFNQVERGSYTVREVLPAGATGTNPASIAVSVTRGQLIVDQDLVEVAQNGHPQRVAGPVGHAPSLQALLLWFGQLGQDNPDPIHAPRIGRGV